MYSTALQKFILAAILLLLTLPLHAQNQNDSVPTEESEGLKIGLALSGGGAKGFAHIGILKVLHEENIPIHMVSGTSMGAIVGSLYAIGYSPEEIEHIALTTDWEILFNDNYRINPQNIASSISNKDTYWFTFPFYENRLNLPTGLIDGQNISMLLYRLMLPYHNTNNFSELPIPFTAVATNLSNGQPHSFTKGYLPDVVRASTAIPTIFKPVKIGEHTYIDGAVARNIPATDIKDLGADLIISSDVGEPIKSLNNLNTFVDILFQSVGFHQLESDERQKEITDIYIRPNIEGVSSFSYGRAEEIIARGEAAARKMLPELREQVLNQQTAPSTFKPITHSHNERFLISDVSFTNISGLLERQTALAINIDTPVSLTLSEIETKVNRLYQSNLYSQISYRIQQHPDNGKRLILDFQQKEQEYAGFSVRYDSKYRAALLFGLSVTENLFQGDRLTGKLRVGEMLELSTRYSMPITLAPLSQANLGIDFQRSPIDFYNQQQAVSTLEVEQITIRPHISVNLWDNLDIETGIEAEFYNLNEAVGNTLVLENTSLILNPFIRMQFHSLNRPYFPTSGQSLNIKTTVSDQRWGSSSSFIQLSGEWTSVASLFSGITLQNTLWGGYSSTSDLPLHYNYYLGGMAHNPLFSLRQHPFMGAATQQLLTTNLWGLRSELQFRLSKSFFLIGGFNTAHLSDTWTLNIDSNRLEYGYALSIGANTFIGPIELSVSTPDFSGGYAAKIDIGYNF